MGYVVCARTDLHTRIRECFGMGRRPHREGSEDNCSIPTSISPPLISLTLEIDLMLHDGGELLRKR